MDSIKPCRRCSEASSQRCDASVLCGPLTPVVYVPIPVAITGSCKNCGKACSYCQDLGSDQSPKYVEEEANHNLIQYRYLSDKESSVNEKEELDCVCNAEKRACNSAQEQSDRDKRAREVNNNCDIYYKLCFCNGGAHFARVTLNQHGSLSSHRAGTNCAKDQLSEPGHCQCQCQTNSDSTRALKVKTTGFESINNCNIHRRLSADSGRVTWSESGDSIISENQVGETSRQTSTAAAKTTVSTSQSQYVMSPVISTSVSASKENVYSKNAEYISLETDRYLQEDELHHFHTRDIPCHSRSNQPVRRFRSHVDSNAGQRFSGAHPRHDSWEENRVPRFSETEVPTLEFISESKHIVMESDRSAENKSNVKLIASQASPVGPRRSASDWAIRKACKTGAKSTRSQLDSLTERDAIIQQTEARPPPRPRSKSLFVDVGSRGGNQSLLLSKKKSQTSSIRLDQVSKADFTKWIHVSRAWEMGVDSQDNRGIKAYGIVAVPSVHGLALTDGAKVKVNIGAHARMS